MSAGLKYTRERLEDAAAQCLDIDEVIAFLGAAVRHAPATSSQAVR